jgi:hypothetical protein
MDSLTGWTVYKSKLRCMPMNVKNFIKLLPIGLAKGNADILSDNYLKQPQINTVVVQQEEMDRVGFEPTTSAMP